VHVIDEVPAFQVAFDSDLATPTNRDVYSLREVYGTVDPARTLRLTDVPPKDDQPAYSLDRRVMAFVSDRNGSPDVFLASALGTDAVNVSGPGSPFPANSVEAEPAFTPINDKLGHGVPNNTLPHLAFMTNASGNNRIVFLDLASQAAGTPVVRTLLDWAGGVGFLSAPVAAQLEPPNTNQSAIAFSPDGRKVAWRHCELTTFHGEIRLLVLRGGNWELHNAGAGFPFDPEIKQPCLDSLTFAPDSRWLAMREGTRISIVDVDFSQPSWTGPRLVVSTPQTGEPRNPSWAPDGSEIAVGLFRAGTVDLAALSDRSFSTAQRLTKTRTSDEPFYHFFKMPPPRVVSLTPEAQFPRSTIDIFGRGFDIIHPRNNKVYFQDTLRRAPHPAKVVATRVDPSAGLGVLTVEVPDFAGHGPLLVETPFGSTSSRPFTVAPKISRIVQQRSVVGARVRLFGLGIDLLPFPANIVEFNPGMTPSGTSTGVRAMVVDGGIDPSGTEEFLTVRVPPGIPPTGSMPVGVFADRVSRPGSTTSGFSLLTPTITLVRTTGLPSYAQQGCAGVTVRLAGRDFPRDPTFNVGTTFVNLNEVAVGGVGTISTAKFVQSASGDTADIPPITFTFPGLGSTHPRRQPYSPRDRRAGAGRGSCDAIPDPSDEHTDRVRAGHFRLLA
jgi:hypothetical protein